MVWGKPVRFSPYRAFLPRPAAQPEGPSTVGEVKGKVKIALLILEILLAIAIIASILLQSGSIMGGGEALFGKKKGLDDTLSKITGILAAVFMVICIIWAILV